MLPVPWLKYFHSFTITYGAAQDYTSASIKTKLCVFLLFHLPPAPGHLEMNWHNRNPKIWLATEPRKRIYVLARPGRAPPAAPISQTPPTAAGLLAHGRRDLTSCHPPRHVCWHIVYDCKHPLCFYNYCNFTRELEIMERKKKNKALTLGKMAICVTSLKKNK